SARLDLHAGPDGVAVAPLAVADQLQPQPMVGRLRAVSQERDRSAVVTEGQVRSAVVVVVGPGQSPADVQLPKIGTDPLRHIPETALAQAEEQLRLLGTRDAQQYRGRAVNVAIRHGDVEAAVEVHVHEDAAEAEAQQARWPQARRIAPFLEEEVALVEV